MNRNKFIKILGLSAVMSSFKLNTLSNIVGNTGLSENIQPVLFFGHGSPMNIIDVNNFTNSLKEIGKTLIKPTAILCISAHWLTQGTYVLASPNPKMIYDMYGFPDELYNFQYKPIGSPEYAKIVSDNIKHSSINIDNERGIDHGNYSVLTHLFPNADIPVFQLSIDYKKPMQYHYELAKELFFLREKGVLIIGSGNITHNLSEFDFDPDANPIDWAVDFDSKIQKAILANDYNSILNYTKLGSSSSIAVPEPSHYIPLIYTVALQDKSEPVSFPYEGFQHGSFSMRAVKYGI